jgi:tricorn protease
MMSVMSNQGYYRFPTIHKDTVVFVCEDDLWTVPVSGRTARRLTSGLGEAGSPCFSPDGKWLAFISRDEGHPEVYVMPAQGGRSIRRTFLGASLARIVGWSRDGRKILFACNGAQPMIKIMKIFAVDREGGVAEEQPYGPAHYLALGTKGVVVGRYGADPARWKRYKGGTVGQLWIDPDGRGRFERLIETGGNLSNPMWIGDRIYFHSDHEGVGNLYSCGPDGKNLKRHTSHEDFYVRHPSTDGKRIVYSSGADLYVLDGATSKKIDVEFHSPRTQRARRFVDAARFFEDFHPHPKGHSVALTIRGKALAMGNWEGAVLQHGQPDGVRYRLARWLPDGKRIAAITDEGGEESLVVFPGGKPLGKLPIGRAIDMIVSPTKDQVVLSNHRYELIHVDLASKKVRVLDRSEHARIAGMAFSPDGTWVAYGFQETNHVGLLRICNVNGGKPVNVTRGVLQDLAPSFDPDGKYLYFLSFREFDPVYDAMHFELGFPRGMRPYLVTLRKDIKSPFVAEIKDPPPPAKEDDKKKKKQEKKPGLQIDLDGIQDRVVAFPLPEGRYGRVMGISGAALISVFPIEGSLGRSMLPSEPPAKGYLEMYKFEEQKKDMLLQGLTDFDLSADRKILYYRAGNRLRAIKAGDKPDEKNSAEPPSRKSGWIDLSRCKVSIDPGAEWLQMFNESCRLMRDHYWVEDMNGMNWREIGDRYRPLVDRVGSRSEFSDLIWELQGELGTSHCYEMGGDYRPEPRYDVGLLGADLQFDAKKNAYRITRVVRGDVWDERSRSPFAAPGINVKEGDLIVAVNGRKVGRHLSPQELLVHRAGQEVLVTLGDGRTITIKTLRSEYGARYREWVDGNRAWVHSKSGGKVGYVHVPDMGPVGFAEFHRQYLAEVDRQALIIDVRYNGGGHVSQLLLEKLARKRLGYNVNRWSPPEPYPGDSPAGPLVALTNELAGSDGDIFSHCFKLFKLGPLVGRRTWGGVVGIWPRHALVDGSLTTQPEFSFWFKDVGFGVENYGTDPDIDIDMAPHDFASGEDPQLQTALEVVQDLLKKNPVIQPAFERRHAKRA